MLGLGRKLGFRGRCGGRGFRHQARNNATPIITSANTPLNNENYEYVGACRCGAGPHAYYEDKNTGNILPASVVYGVNNTASNNTKLSDRLKHLEDEIKKLKEALKGN
jgi:hypothetical protein